jgi:hypothetical protein
MEIPDREALAQFAREHHVHYEVEPETTVEGERREVVGFDVRLLATHGDREPLLETPACPQCVELLSELSGFAERLTSTGDAASWTELVPEPAVLRESTEQRGDDEVALTMRIHRDPGERRTGAASDDRRLSEIRERLEAAGVTRT